MRVNKGSVGVRFEVLMAVKMSEVAICVVTSWACMWLPLFLQNFCKHLQPFPCAYPVATGPWIRGAARRMLEGPDSVLMAQCCGTSLGGT
jgi:hypothetical protein